MDASKSNVLRSGSLVSHWLYQAVTTIMGHRSSILLLLMSSAAGASLREKEERPFEIFEEISIRCAGLARERIAGC
jgi:hypothetical protein